ncbi:C-type lectin domain family 4 member A-like [Protopterus annectens]|uniref:C-type lectin domain family 4 member A-like n=1 Tax=Protopterus annectens TaxID=7888 RepID=UPI001CFBE7C1|nr:C-type lectin domain family 4 member A-like [Protopterus annectens]
MEEENIYQELQAITEDTYSEINQKQTEKPRAQPGGAPRQEDGRKKCKKRMVLALSIITITILLVIIIPTVVWRKSKLPGTSEIPPADDGTSGLPNETPTPDGKWSECCPEDWMIFDHNCYYFSSMYYNWSEAQKQCEKNQSNLVMIKSAEQQTPYSVLALCGTPRVTQLLTEYQHLCGTARVTQHFIEYQHPSDTPSVTQHPIQYQQLCSTSSVTHHLFQYQHLCGTTSMTWELIQYQHLCDTPRVTQHFIQYQHQGGTPRVGQHHIQYQHHCCTPRVTQHLIQYQYL